MNGPKVKFSKDGDDWRIRINGKAAGRLRPTNKGWRTAMAKWKAYDRMGFRTLEDAKVWFGRTFTCQVQIDEKVGETQAADNEPAATAAS